MDKIFIILLNYNNYIDTIECIKSIKENEKQIEYEIIVVDNKSTNNSVEELEKIEGIHLIKAEDNKGFSHGNNLGIEYAINNKAEYLLLLNNDTIITENSISKIYKEMTKHNDVGIMGARIMYHEDKNKINYIGGRVNWNKGTVIIERKGKTYIEEKQDFKYTEFVTGCCMLIKKETIEKLGYLPEQYFMYYEDIDYCVNAKRHGYKLGVCLNSIIYHKESASSGGMQSAFSIKWNTRNRLIFIERYVQKKVLALTWFYTTRVIVIMKYLLKGERDKISALLEGIKEGRKYNKVNNK